MNGGEQLFHPVLAEYQKDMASVRGNKINTFQFTTDFPTQIKQSGIKYFPGRIEEIGTQQKHFLGGNGRN